MNSEIKANFPIRLKGKAISIFRNNLESHQQNFDRIMAGVLIFNWLLGIVFALIISPTTWIGDRSLVNFHVWLAVIQGGVQALFPVCLVIFFPGKSITRHSIAMAQCLFASLFVHLTGGRIETHFYYFGSLAFLAFYRDWKVIATGTIFVAVDHMIRGIFFPLSVYGTSIDQGFRWLEHAAWVVVMDVVLFLGYYVAIREVKEIAEKRAEVEDYSLNMEGLVKEQTFELEAAKKEQDTIMNAVNEGLFIMHRKDGEYYVGTQQSEAVQRIFEGANLSGKKFINVVEAYFSPRVIEEMGEYLKMLASDNQNENLVQDLNPLENVEGKIKSENGSTNKHLKFGFKRIIQAQQKTDFLVTVKDITQEVVMAQQIRNQEIKAEQETQMMLSILHVGPALLQDFMEGVEIELSVIDSVLRDDQNHKDLKIAIETISRAVHSLKGNAALIDLKFLSERAHEFEEKIIFLRENQQLSWEDFLSIAVELAKLKEIYQGMSDLILRIQNFKNKGIDAESALSAVIEAMTGLAQRVAEEQGKSVKVNAINPDFTGVSNKYAYILRDILVQLTRNAITHGIENPEIRLQSGKPENGEINLTLKPDGETFAMGFRDDGRSFDFTAIRAKAVQLGKATAEEIKTWEPSKLIKLTLEPGFSTADESTLHAGRGMGMDIIKQRIKKIGGQMKINFSQGKFTEFQFMFPMGALQK